MPIDRGTVQKIAALARLRVEPAEEERYVRELQAILTYVTAGRTNAIQDTVTSVIKCDI